MIANVLMLAKRLCPERSLHSLPFNMRRMCRTILKCHSVLDVSQLDSHDYLGWECKSPLCPHPDPAIM